MAITVEVNTWEQLVTALSTNTPDIKTIKITSDIDCNYEIPLGVTDTVVCYGSNAYPTTVDGSYTENGVIKNHVIRNLRTNVQNPVSIFGIRTNLGSGSRACRVVFKNIDFVNLVLMGGNLIGWYDDGVIGGRKIDINGCRFVGRRNRYIFAGSDSSLYGDVTYFQMTSCFFNVPYFPDSVDNTYVPLIAAWTGHDIWIRAYFCWFREYYNGWTLGVYSPGVSRAPHTSTYNMDLDGCYIDGTIVGQETSIGISNNYSYNAVIQNVVDADLRVADNSGSATVRIYAPKGIYRTAENNNTNVVKKYEDDSVNCPISNQNASAVPETPSRMISPADLYADGFDIIVPDA